MSTIHFSLFSERTPSSAFAFVFLLIAMKTHLQHSNFSAETSPGGLSRAGHTAAAVFLGFILVLGFLGNFLVLLVFSRFSGLRTPANLLFINISISDMLVCIFGTSLSFTASVRGKWLTGSYGCQWYGFSNALFGERTLFTLYRLLGYFHRKLTNTNKETF